MITLLLFQISAPPSALAQTPLFHELVSRVTFSPDGQRAVFSAGKKLRVWDVMSGKEQRGFEGHEFEIYCAVFSSDGRHILSGDGGNMRLWDAKSGKQLSLLQGRNGNLSGLAFSPNGHYAVSAHSKGSGIQRIPPLDLFLWDLKSGEPVCRDELVIHRLIAQRLFIGPASFQRRTTELGIGFACCMNGYSS